MISVIQSWMIPMIMSKPIWISFSFCVPFCTFVSLLLLIVKVCYSKVSSSWMIPLFMFKHCKIVPSMNCTVDELSWSMNCLGDQFSIDELSFMSCPSVSCPVDELSRSTNCLVDQFSIDESSSMSNRVDELSVDELSRSRKKQRNLSKFCTFIFISVDNFEFSQLPEANFCALLS